MKWGIDLIVYSTLVLYDEKRQNNVLKANVVNVSRYMYQKEHHFLEQHCSCYGLLMMSALGFKVEIEALVAGFSKSYLYQVTSAVIQEEITFLFNLFCSNTIRA